MIISDLPKWSVVWTLFRHLFIECLINHKDYSIEIISCRVSFHEPNCIKKPIVLSIKYFGKIILPLDRGS